MAPSENGLVPGDVIRFPDGSPSRRNCEVLEVDPGSPDVVVRDLQTDEEYRVADSSAERS